MTLHELQLTAADEVSPGLLRLALRLQAYRALQASATLPSVALAARPPHDPFEPFATATGELPLDQARMVGYLRDPQGPAALIGVGGVVHLLRQGDRFGAGRILAVEEGHVEIQDTATGIGQILRLVKS